MKIYGPFRGINNPLVMGMFGLQALDEGVKVIQAFHEGQQRDLLAHALADNTVEPSQPGGPFRQGLSKLTGGLVSPDVQADPETVLAERQAQQSQKQMQLKDLTEVLGLRSKIGPGPFQSGAPLDLLAQQYGGTPGMAAEPTLQEKNEQDKVKQQEITNERLSPAGQYKSAVARKAGEIDEESSPEGMRLFRTKTSTEAAARAAANLDEASSPAALGLFKTKATMAADIANDKAAKRDQQKKDELASTPVSDLASNKTSGGVYVRKSDLKLATGAVGEPKTKAEADSNGDYQFVPNKQVDGPGGLKDTIAQTRKIDQMLQLLNSGAADDIFPSEKGKNWAAIKRDQLDYGTVNNSKRSQDPVRNKWYNMYADLIRYYTGLQHRFPNVKELEIPLAPDPGGLVPSGHPILRIGGINPLRSADTKEVARQKLMDMRETILGHFATGAGIGSIEADSDDDADFMDAARKSGAIK
jgi:hypothetical protein